MATTRLIGMSAVLAAVYARITTGWAAIMPTIPAYRVYNNVPARTAFPYVHIGEAIYGPSESFSARDSAAEDQVAHIHIWSEYKGDKEVGDMMNAISEAITTVPLSISGYSLMLSRKWIDYAAIMTDDTNPNQILRHGIIRLRLQIA